MKRFIISLCILSLYADNEQSVFAQANSAYVCGNYNDALTMLLSIEPKSPSVWYNAGNAAYQVKQYGLASAYWLRALRTCDALVYRDALHNYVYVQHMLGNEISWRARVRWYVQLLSCYVPFIFLQFMVLIYWIVLYYIRRRTQYMRLLMIIGSILAITVGGMTYLAQDDLHAAVVLNHDVRVYAGPNSSFYQLATLHQAEHVHTITHTSGWCKIAHKDGVGWVSDADILAVYD